MFVVTEMGALMAVTLELAISAIRAGRKQEGRQLLNLLIQQNPNNEAAWLWMSQVVESDKQRERCLYHVLALNPENQPARRGLQLLGVVVTDSRPVKLPPDLQVRPASPPRENGAGSQPDAKTKPETAEPGNDTSGRPFLINPDTFTKELPFVPVKQAAREPIQASPAILSLKVDDDDEAESSAETAAPGKTQAATHSDTSAADRTTTPDIEAASSPEPVYSKTDTNPIAPATNVTPDLAATATEPDSNPEPTTVTAAPALNVINAEPTEPAASPNETHSAGPISLPVVTGAGALALSTATEAETAPRQAASNSAGDAAGAGSTLAGAEQTAQPERVKPVEPSPQPPAIEPGADTTDPATTITQKMPSPFEPAPATAPNAAADSPGPPPAAPQTDSTQVAPQAAPPAGQTPSSPMPPQPQQIHPNQFAGQHYPPNIPLETRQSQPVLINFPMPTAGLPQEGQGYYPAGNQMPYNQPQNQGYYPGPAQYHHAATMGMPMLPAGYNRPPSEPVPPIPTGHSHFSGQPMPPGMSLHSNATMMMPTMSEAEARARLATSQAIPTANAAAMPLQNGGAWPQPPGFGLTGYPQEYHDYVEEDEEEDEGEINILAVIIFGTLSITALGGLGMLVLLLVTTSPSAI